MPLDFIAAKNQKEINYISEIYSLDENAHSILMKFAKPRKEFPLINKISDYYSDSCLVLGELESFNLELIKLIKKNTEIKSIFLNLVSFVENAKLNKDNIYITAD